MKNLKINKYWVFSVSAILWLAIDLFSKYYVLNSGIGPIVFVKNFFYLTFQKNRGIAFGIPLVYEVQLIASIFVLGLLVYFGFKYLLIQKRNTFLNQFLLGIIAGGAIGNLINRIHLGYVVDFISLKPFPVFNIADIGITVGLILLFLLTYKTNINH